MVYIQILIAVAAVYDDMFKMGAAYIRLITNEYGGTGEDVAYAFDKGTFSLADKDGKVIMQGK